MGRFQAHSSFVHLKCLVILCALQIGATIADESAPIISPEADDTTVNPGDNVQFSCMSDEPVTWRFQSHLDVIMGTSELYAQDDERPYQSSLYLGAVTYFNVGYYYCVKNSSLIDDNNQEIEIELEDLLQNGKAARIYLYVNDTENRVAEPPYTRTGYIGEWLIIPCKPTSKDFKVQLYKDDEKTAMVDFDPKSGFNIKITEEASVDYHCKVNGTEIDRRISVSVYRDNPHLNKPIVSTKNENFGVRGENLEFNCSIEHPAGSSVQISWVTPHGNIAELEERLKSDGAILQSHPHNPLYNIGIYHIVIEDVDPEKDIGTYQCIVKDRNKATSARIDITRIIEPDDTFINITEPSGKYDFEVSSQQNQVQWYLKYASYPSIETLEFRDKNKEVVPWMSGFDTDTRKKIEAKRESRRITVLIRNISIADSGTYTLYANNGKMDRERRIELKVKEKPLVNVTNAIVKPGQQVKLTCSVYGYPTSKITWSYVPCVTLAFDHESCKNDEKVTFTKEQIQIMQLSDFIQNSTIKFTPESTGFVTCNAKNTEGTSEAKAEVVITDLDKEFIIWSNGNEVAANEQYSIWCGASAHKYATELYWYKNDVLVENSSDVSVMPHDTPYSHRKEIHWNSIDKAASGRYECRGNIISNDTAQTDFLDLEVLDPSKPRVKNTTIGRSTEDRSLGDPFELTCEFSGLPHPEIRWYKDDTEIISNVDDRHLTIAKNSTLLIIDRIVQEDEAKYRCEATNRHGSESLQTKLRISYVLSTAMKEIIIGILVLILFLIVCTIYLIMRIKRERRLFKELKAAGLANFETGNVESINPDLGLDEQADLLPYDKKYEFPREKLKLDKQLGSGAFGVVMRATAQGILPYENETVVAVKMVKKMADNDVMRALISELKIMVHLGQHLNVVNLLGAVTKNIAQREVMVIVEYCRFGSLQNFLVKHRNYFVDQIVRDKDMIDPTILVREQRWSSDSGFPYYNRDDANRQSSEAESRVNSAYIRQPSSRQGDFFPTRTDSANTETTLIPRNAQLEGEDNYMTSNNSTQPAWRSNYRMDYKGPARSVTTTDLLCWAFQVSRGMQYLSSRKVLHGDLAARNILLCDDNVVKICDFGLARSMYKTDVYHKKGESPLPFKWLALESISHQVFSTHSDVWSFGIVLWELFSLGKVPYPGMDADQSLYFKIKDGYRMEKPEYATQDIYDIMLSCWRTSAESRPLFDSLETTIGDLLGMNVAEHYIDLNEPYLKSNISHLAETQTDYLALMGAPDGYAPPIPSYVNSHVIPMPPGEENAQPSYLSVRPSVPTTEGIDTHDSFYDFPTINSPTTINNLNAGDAGAKLRNKISSIPEEIPMLNRSNQSTQSDSDSEPNGIEESSLHRPSTAQLQQSPQHRANNNNAATDGYVNVPSRKMLSVKKDAVSNPGYIVVSKINETET